MQLTLEQLAAAIGCHKDRAAKWLPHINEATRRFGIDSLNETASFLAQIAHESNRLATLVENTNYSADGLAATWPKRYRDPSTGKPNQMANYLHRKPMAIANHVYAGRMGNGGAETNDGYNYRGRGALQISGKTNYLHCGTALGIDLIHYPDKLQLPEVSALAAGWFWQANKLDAHDDDLSVLAETKIINGGTIGLADRDKKFKIALAALKGN